jgi:hypothetical protein
VYKIGDFIPRWELFDSSMHTGDRSYSIYNNKVFSIIFYSDKFLSYKKHFHFENNINHINAFKNSNEIRVFLSKKCETNIDFKQTIRNQKLIFSEDEIKCPSEFFFVGCLYPWQICKSNNSKYPYYVSLGCTPLPIYAKSILK